jgi:hypothetical protein
MYVRHRQSHWTVLSGAVMVLCSLTPLARAELSITWHTVDAGGHTFSGGGTYDLGGTCGQPDAGVVLGGTYRLGGGFWRGGQGLSGVVAGPGGEFELPAPVTFLVQTDARNPFTTQTGIRLELPTAQPVDVRIFDHAGRLVCRVFEGWLPPGRHSLVWVGDAHDGRQAPAGVYLLQVRVGDHITHKRLVYFR